jgi:proteasome accessory factor C
MSGPRNAEDRLRRLLVMLPWLMEVGEAPLAEVARRFEMSEAEVQRELELVAMCGLPPFVDEMIDVFVDDGMVFVGVPRLFTRPLRLTAPEAFSLLTSARAAMELPGADLAGPLGRGLSKLAAALADVGIDADADDTAGVVVDLGRPELADELAETAASGNELEITYYSPARDDVSRRTIVPLHVFADAGNWYLLADDGRSGSRRTFRIDRIESVVATGRHVDAELPALPPERFFDDADLPRATIRLGPDARWVLDQYPIDEVIEREGGWVEARLPVTSDRWLAKLLIRLGPDAKLVEPANPAVALARAMLDRY